jgi:hypothetical protein
VCRVCVNGFTSEECLWMWMCDHLTKHVVWVVTSIQVSYVSVKTLCTKSYVGASPQKQIVWMWKSDITIEKVSKEVQNGSATLA